MEMKVYRVKDIDWDAMVQIPQFPLPVQVTVPVVDVNDPEAVHQDVTVDVVTTLMLRNFLINHFDWSWISPEIGQGDVAYTRFADLWVDFLARKDEAVYRAVRSICMEYNPALTYFKHEAGDTDVIEYGRMNVTNSGGMSETTNRTGKLSGVSMSAADTDGYKETSVQTSFTNGENIKTTTKVSTYDAESFSNLSESTNSGDSATLSGSANSAKSTDSGKDTHSRDLRIDGSDALHTTVDMIRAEIELRLQTDIGKMLLQQFAEESLILMC